MDVLRSAARAKDVDILPFMRTVAVIDTGIPKTRFESRHCKLHRSSRNDEGTLLASGRYSGRGDFGGNTQEDPHRTIVVNPVNSIRSFIVAVTVDTMNPQLPPVVQQ